MDNNQPIWLTLKRLLSYGYPYRDRLTIAVVMLWIAAAAEVSGPVLISHFLDHTVASGSLSIELMGRLALIYLLLQFLAAALHYFQSLLFNQAAVSVVQRLRIDVMDAALRQPMSTFDLQPVGQLISRVTNDTEVIKDLYIVVVSNIFKSVALIGAILVAMFSLNWRMALISVCIFPAVFIVMGIYQYYSTPIIRRARAYLADINDCFNEMINGMGVIQQFRQQVRFGERIGATNRSHYLERMKTLRLEGFLLRPLLNLFSALVLCSLLVLFGFSAEGTIGVGVLYAFITYLSRLDEPLVELTSQQSIMQEAIVAGERIFNLMDLAPQKYGTDEHPLNSGSIVVDNVTFAYRADKVILQHISLEVPSCSFIALVGQTGSGKSTLANLLMGFYPLQHGEIRLDGRPLQDLSHTTLRQGIAMVQQDPVVLAESVFANISLGRDISETQVWQALEMVQLAALIRALPEGLDTHLGEQGNNFSVGQKQLLAMARVLVQTPRILLLDEATANIDSGTEQAIQRALQLIRQNTTLVVIAHRLSTIVDADTIFVLHHGLLVEQGKHRHLLAQQGKYYQMYQLQLASQDLGLVSQESIC